VLLALASTALERRRPVGKLARVLVADGRRVVLGAADTFRAAAAHQLQTWAPKVGAQVGAAEGADPASVAFDASTRASTQARRRGHRHRGRLHTKTGLMDDSGRSAVVSPARRGRTRCCWCSTPRSGRTAGPGRVFAEVVDITGVLLTKLDGTAKGASSSACSRNWVFRSSSRFR